MRKTHSLILNNLKKNLMTRNPNDHASTQVLATGMVIRLGNIIQPLNEELTQKLCVDKQIPVK